VHGTADSGAVLTERLSFPSGRSIAVISEDDPCISGSLKVRVDPNKCQGNARCKSLAPELFELDEWGYAHEIGDGTVPAGLEDKAWLAQANCPEIAITIDEE